jgi:LAO/AO transport system kinase
MYCFNTEGVKKTKFEKEWFGALNWAAEPHYSNRAGGFFSRAPDSRPPAPSRFVHKPVGFIFHVWDNLRYMVDIQKVLAGDVRSVARAISLVENGADEAGPLMKEVFPRTGRALVVGITGSPGAGKSSLVDKLALLYRNQGEKVGIICVDPSSPFTGGAILGDRIRMQTLGLDKNVFIRSMATRGNLGGLARATVDAVAVLDAAGYQKIIVETVGVGQDEVEIVKTADVCVVVLVPGMGDDIQAIKAGIMEIGDVFVINKADREGVLRTEKELEALLSLAMRPDFWNSPIVKTVAIENKGITDLSAAIESYREFCANRTGGADRMQAIARWRLIELLREKLLAQTLDAGDTSKKLDLLAAQVAEKQRDPYSAVEELLRGSKDREKMSIDHLGIATAKVEDGLSFWQKALGLPLKGTEEVAEQQVQVAMLPLGEANIELLEPTSDSSPIAKFLSKRGPGIHHLAVRVDDICAILSSLKENGTRLIDNEPRVGAGGCLIAFIHPSATNGVLVELVQRPAGTRH